MGRKWEYWNGSTSTHCTWVNSYIPSLVLSTSTPWVYLPDNTTWLYWRHIISGLLLLQLYSVVSDYFLSQQLCSGYTDGSWPLPLYAHVRFVRFFYSRTHARWTLLSSSPSPEVAQSVVPWAAIVSAWTRCQERGRPGRLSHIRTPNPEPEPSLRRTQPSIPLSSTVSERPSSRLITALRAMCRDKEAAAEWNGCFFSLLTSQLELNEHLSC